MVNKIRFVQEYLNLIGDLGEKYNSVYWWASFTASKNKFISGLFIDLYRFVTIGQQSPQTFKYAIISSLRFIISTWIKIMIARILFYKKVKTIDYNQYYVLRTWLYERSVDGMYYDSFFGILPEYLHKHRKLIVIAGVIGRYDKIAWKLSHIDEEYPIIAQEYFLKFSDPVRAVIDAWTNIPVISDKIEFMGCDVTDIVRQGIRKDFENFVPGQYLYYIMMQRISNSFSINKFITTFENNPYERMQILALKDHSPETVVYGYHHLPLADSAMNMYLGEHEFEIVPVPNKIITIGDITKDILENQKYPCKVVAGCGLRFSQMAVLKKRLWKNPVRILITPEGGLSESVGMVNFVCSAFKDEKGVSIIIRSHPELPFEDYKQFLRFDILKWENVRISGVPLLTDDINGSDVLIYRGSSSVLSAISAGLATVYIEFEKDVVSFDPVKENTALKYIVKTESELKNVIGEISALTDEEYIKKSGLARKFLSNYIKEVTIDNLEVFL